MWSGLKNYSDGALLFLRVILGTLFLYLHGWPVLAGGIGRWRGLGEKMGYIGVHIAPGFWGFIAACSESLGCLLFIIGFVFRPSCLMLFLTMTVLAIAEYRSASLGRAEYEIVMALLFFTMMFVGPGKFSVDKG
jgi:putative oxidoreductase